MISYSYKMNNYLDDYIHQELVLTNLEEYSEEIQNEILDSYARTERKK